MTRRLRNIGLFVVSGVLTGVLINCTHADEAMLGLARAALSNPGYEIHLEDYLQAADNGDYALAIERAEIDCLTSTPDGATRGSGCTIKLACGKTYTLKSTADICTPTLIEGCGTGRGLAGSLFKQVTKQTAFKAWFRDEGCVIQGQPVPAHGSVTMNHVAILNTNVSSQGDPPFYGIEAHTRIYLNDVLVQGFVHGVHAQCDVLSTPKTGCNIMSFNGVDLYNNEHAGLYLQGGDTNANSFVALSAQSNCTRASRWNQTFKLPGCSATPPPSGDDGLLCTNSSLLCANVVDLSFLGNTYVAPQAADAIDRTNSSSPVRYPNYVFGRATATNVALGVYGEGTTNQGVPPSFVGGPGTVLGGTSQFSAGGYALNLHGNVASALVVKNDLDPANPVQVEMGRATNSPGTFEAHRFSNNPWPLRLKYVPSIGSYQYDVGNVGWSMRIMQQLGGGGGGQFWAQEKIKEGASATDWCFSTPTHVCP